MGWESILQGGLPLALAALLLSAGLEDVRAREIANWKNGIIAALAPIWWLANGWSVWPDMVWQVALACAVLMLFAAAFHFGVMGGGDVKMIASLALWFPFPAFAQFLVVMSLAGGAVTAALLIERRWRKGEIEVPYGVAIAIAGMLALREPVLNQLS